MTPELKQFFEDYLDWACRGAPDQEPFYRDYGLCSNSDDYNCHSELVEFLYKDFPTNHGLPFNDGLADYSRECGSHHLNPKRIEWVKKILDPNS